MKMNLDNENDVKERIRQLIRSIENRTDKTDFIKELMGILNEIDDNSEYKEKYSDIYDDACDVILVYTSSGPKACRYDAFIKKMSKK